MRALRYFGLVGLLGPLTLASACLTSNDIGEDVATGGRATPTGGTGGAGATAGAPSTAGATAVAGAAGTTANPECNDRCTYANDGWCDEPYLCNVGEDCTDCANAIGAGGAGSCTNVCPWANDGACDEPYLCPVGTDCADCGEAGGEDPPPPPVDPCAGVSTDGECTSTTHIRYCSVPTSDSDPTLVEWDCDAGTHCVEADGKAACVPDGCVPDTTECVDATTLRTCTGAGDWSVEACPEACRVTAGIAACGAGSPTVEYTGTLQYEARTINGTRTDWGTPFTAPARGVSLLIERDGEVIDSTTTGEDGTYSLQIPADYDASDTITVLLVGPRADAPGFAVAVPDVSDGTYQPHDVDGESSSVWAFTISPVDTPSGSTVTVTEAQGSGALRVFDYLHFGYEHAATAFGSAPRSVVAWVRPNTAWSCGACFSSMPSAVDNEYYDSQIWIGATQLDEAYWSDAVIVHELGHFVMSAYGYSPGEGGRHCLGVKTFPGQAWSEGWATAFSAMVRDEPIYYDKQGGSFFWFELPSRTYSGGYEWNRGDPSLPVSQKMDENEVARMVWDLYESVGSGPIYAALASPALTTPPFGRGYKRTQWSMEGCTPYDAYSTGDPAPMFADFLDALACDGVAPSIIDAVTDPTTSFPYDSESPLCP